MNMQAKLQQSLPIEQWFVPQIQFIDGVLDIPVMPQRQVRTVQAVHLTGDSIVQFLERLLSCPLLFQRQGDGPDSAELFGGGCGRRLRRLLQEFPSVST